MSTAIQRPEALDRVDPTWYRHAVFYELLVRGFADGNNDGVGDFTGLTNPRNDENEEER